MKFLTSKTHKIEENSEVKRISGYCAAVLVQGTGQLFYNVRRINTVSLLSRILLLGALSHGGKTKQNQDTERCKIGN